MSVIAGQGASVVSSSRVLLSAWQNYQGAEHYWQYRRTFCQAPGPSNTFQNKLLRRTLAEPLLAILQEVLQEVQALCHDLMLQANYRPDFTNEWLHCMSCMLTALAECVIPHVNQV